MMAYYIGAAVVMVVFAGISWFVTGLLHLPSSAEMFVRLLLMGLIMCGFALAALVESNT